MTKLLSGVLMAAVLSMGLPMAASAHDNDRGDHHRHCRLVKKTIWKHGHKRVVFKKVCFDRHDH